MKDDVQESGFLKDVARHLMTIELDQGVYRSVLFKRSETGCMHFRLTTWPGHLAISGDMGTYVFSRLHDMFEFFRGKPEGPLQISLGYWAEKVQAAEKHGGVDEFDPDAFRATIDQYLLDYEDTTDELRREVEDQVLCCVDDGEYAANAAVHQFEGEGGFRFMYFFEHRHRRYRFHFIWACYAIAWGIRQYDAAPAAKEA